MAEDGLSAYFASSYSHVVCLLSLPFTMSLYLAKGQVARPDMKKSRSLGLVSLPLSSKLFTYLNLMIVREIYLLEILHHYSK
jgi:hypothetical protein